MTIRKRSPFAPGTTRCFTGVAVAQEIKFQRGVPQGLLDGVLRFRNGNRTGTCLVMERCAPCLLPLSSIAASNPSTLTCYRLMVAWPSRRTPVALS